MSATPTSLTIASSITLRLRALAPRIYSLGPRPLYEAMCSLVGGADPMSTFESYGALGFYSDLIESHGGRDLSPTIRAVK